MDERASTMVEGEKRWAPVTYACCGACFLLGIVLLIVSALSIWGATDGLRCGVWTLCCCLWLIPTASNLHYARTHALPTVGMAPVAVASLIPAALAVMAVSPSAMSSLWPLCLRVAIVTLVAALGITVFFCVWFARLHGAYAHAPQVAEDAVIIVLGGAVRNGACCRTLVRRLVLAQDLWRKAPKRVFVLTGGPSLTGETTEAEAMAAWLRAHGVSESSLLLEPQARNTQQNLELSLQVLGGPPAQQLCVLTSDFHLYRALREGRRAGVELVPIPAPTPRASVAQQWSREVLTLLMLS